ncbi:MAG: DNA primase catalytic subunit PriS [Euryarchaeota archaeon]|nr:DNA primase catalytic subunit PriS [Euryarchaeota archaeon]
MAADQSPSEAPPKAGPPKEQVEATVDFINRVFSEYYETAEIHMPSRFGRREFGFMFLAKDFVVRHIGFKSQDELRRFLVESAPSHAYYSTAYYEKPDAPTMNEKGWLGADLIFDLDADHLEGAKEMTYEKMLAQVKVETLKLVEDFLPDFGFDPGSIHIVFSGGRGYHIHVADPKVWQLKSGERREIVDYVTGNGVDVEGVIRKTAYAKDDFGGTKKTLRMPSVDEPAWRGRLARNVAAFLERLRGMEREDAVKLLTAVEGIGKKKAGEIYDRLRNDIADRAGTTKMERLRSGVYDQFEALATKDFVAFIKDRAAVFAAGETDEPVTSDIKRLIRLPGSLHGKSGLTVTPLTIDELRRFEPLRDAAHLPDDEVHVKVSGEMSFPLQGKKWDVKPGETSLPLYAAAFLMLRRKALISLENGPLAKKPA